MRSDNAAGAVNQQERLDAYIAGYVDGEGSFHVAVQRNRFTRLGWQLVPEFHVSQNAERREVLDLIHRRLACGRIKENHRGSKDTSLVFVVRNRGDLLTSVIPFFETNPLLSSKQQDFLTFAAIVRAMAAGRHLSPEGFRSLRRLAVSMNGGGRYRRVHRDAGIQNPQRPYAGHPAASLPSGVDSRGEDMVRPPWRHGEPGGTETTWPSINDRE